MTTGPRGRVGAPRVRPVFSIWAWLALTPYLLTAIAGNDWAATPQQLALGILAAVLVHAVLLTAFLLLGMIERAAGDLPWLRWSIVGLGLLGIGAGRPVLVTAVQGALGINLVETVSPLRFLTNLFVIALGCLLTYALIETAVRARDSARRLRSVLDALKAEESRIAATGEQVRAAFQRELATQVLDALGELLHRQPPPDVLASELRWIARSVVQRASDQARGSALDEALADTASLPVVRAARDQTSAPAPAPAAAARLRAAPGWLITLVATILLLPQSIATHGLLVGPLLLLVAMAASLLLTVVISRVALPRRRGAALAVLTGLYATTAAICCRVLLGTVEVDLLIAYYLGYGIIGYTVVAVALSIVMSGVDALRVAERRAAAAIAACEHQRFEARRSLAAEASRTGSLLETDVQGDILATSFRIDAGTAPTEVLDELIDRIEYVLRQGSEPAPEIATDIREGLRSTLRAWSRTLQIETELDEEALEWLGAHPASAGLAHEALTKGLTNVVRHSRSSHAAVRLHTVDDAVELSVSSPGRLSARDPDGLGLRALDVRAAAVDLRQVGADVELRVRIGRAG